MFVIGKDEQMQADLHGIFFYICSVFPHQRPNSKKRGDAMENMDWTQNAIIRKHTTNCCWAYVVISFNTVLCFTKWWTSPHPRFGTTEPFPGRPFNTQSWYCHLLRMTRLFSEHSTTIPVFCLPCPDLFEMCCWHDIQNQHVFFVLFTKIKLLTFNKVKWGNTLNILSL